MTPALTSLEHALKLAAPEGYVRIFVEEGNSMARLLSEAATRGIMPDYTGKLLAVLKADGENNEGLSTRTSAKASQPLVEPLSERELEILQLIAQGHSNREICERLFLAIPTVKGHNRNIFGKLQVRNRTEAVAHAPVNWLCCDLISLAIPQNNTFVSIRSYRLPICSFCIERSERSKNETSKQNN
jgi:LuxR family maltose regulon positive regulatory protein